MTQERGGSKGSSSFVCYWGKDEKAGVTFLLHTPTEMFSIAFPTFIFISRSNVVLKFGTEIMNGSLKFPFAQC